MSLFVGEDTIAWHCQTISAFKHTIPHPTSTLHSKVVYIACDQFQKVQWYKKQLHSTHVHCHATSEATVWEVGSPVITVHRPGAVSVIGCICYILQLHQGPKQPYRPDWLRQPLTVIDKLLNFPERATEREKESGKQIPTLGLFTDPVSALPPSGMFSFILPEDVFVDW